MPLLVLLSGPPTSQPDYSFLNLILMASYVGLTLILAIVAIVSIVISSRLSRKALKDSEKQSKDAIDAVQKQIDASKEQTKDTIDAINRQIQASEKQAQEALYNQHKPVIVPLTNPISRDGNIFEVNMQNKGSGVALNTSAFSR